LRGSLSQSYHNLLMDLPYDIEFTE
jgi:hypothetical protein